jgi:hypothetical protein
MPIHTGAEPVYRAYQHFKERCLLGTSSLLWPEMKVWTPENVTEVKRRVVDNPHWGDLSFTEKLQQQMEGAASEHWAILADIYFVYYLISMTLTPHRKRAGIQWAIQQGELPQPDVERSVWEALDKGFVRTGQRFNMKYAQFWLLLLLADNLKRSPNPSVIVNHPKELQRLLDELLMSIERPFDRANDMRRAILHMAFPEKYEAIISGQDRELLLQTYGELAKPLPEDVDEALFKIREALNKQFKPNELPFNYYSPSMITKWKHTNSRQSKVRDEVPEEPVDEEEQIPSRGMIFISYRREDTSDTTQLIYKTLVNAFSEDQVFIDVKSIPYGIDFRKYLNSVLNDCKAMLVIIGRDWMTIKDSEGHRRLDDETDWVRTEVATALRRDIPVIPIRVRGARPPKPTELPSDLESLAWRQGLEVRSSPHFDGDIQIIINELKSILR